MTETVYDIANEPATSCTGVIIAVFIAVLVGGVAYRYRERKTAMAFVVLFGLILAILLVYSSISGQWTNGQILSAIVNGKQKEVEGVVTSIVRHPPHVRKHPSFSVGGMKFVLRKGSLSGPVIDELFWSKVRIGRCIKVEYFQDRIVKIVALPISVCERGPSTKPHLGTRNSSRVPPAEGR